MRSDIGRTVLWSRRDAGQTLSGAVYTSSTVLGTERMIYLEERKGQREGE